MIDIKREQQRIDQVIKLMRQNGHSHIVPPDRWGVGTSNDSWSVKPIYDHWGGLSPVEHKEAEKAIREVPVDKPKSVLRDLIITSLRVNHEKRYVTVSMHPRSDVNKKISMQVPLNHKALKNLDLNEIYDVYGDMRVYHDGRVKVVKFHKMTSL